MNKKTMKHSNHLLPFMILALIIALGSCKPKKTSGEPTEAEDAVEASTPAPDGHNSRISLDWNGTYKGVLPCADCEGIKTSLTLMESGEFRRTLTYLGREEAGSTETGTFEWDADGATVTIHPGEGEPQSYQVGENRLFHLDREGNRISGDLAENYVLVKNRADYQLENKKWVLTELMGKEVATKEGQKEAFLLFDQESGRLSGNNSCNLVNGSYELLEGNRIRLGPVASTMMACPDMEIQDQFNEVLGRIDNYTVADGVLSLNKARMAPLARFRLQEE